MGRKTVTSHKLLKNNNSYLHEELLTIARLSLGIIASNVVPHALPVPQVLGKMQTAFFYYFQISSQIVKLVIILEPKIELPCVLNEGPKTTNQNTIKKQIITLYRNVPLLPNLEHPRGFVHAEHCQIHICY